MIFHLSVPKGSIYGFIGPNGSGKTTTIRMIMKIMYPDRGNILINGRKHMIPTASGMWVTCPRTGGYTKK